jgi:uncharacterized protein YbaR (Trm112 family)
MGDKWVLYIPVCPHCRSEAKPLLRNYGVNQVGTFELELTCSDCGRPYVISLKKLDLLRATKKAHDKFLSELYGNDEQDFRAWEEQMGVEDGEDSA